MSDTQQPFVIGEHMLVPTHTKLDAAAQQQLLVKYNISLKQLPQIKQSDPAIQHLTPTLGDVIQINRKSPTIGETSFYRVVVYG